MSQLIHMQQRIKAVETIKKITQAMRLISMSTHSRLRQKKAQLESYKEAFEKLGNKIKQIQSTYNKENDLHTTEKTRHLIILVSSQKGLCGTFNSQLFRFFESKELAIDKSYDFISVGRYALDYLQKKNLSLFASYDNCTSEHFVHIANAISDIIINYIDRYITITVYHNYPKTFFIQKPQKTSLIPAENVQTTPTTETSQTYLLEGSLEQLNSLIERLVLSISLQEALFESLLAEQAARFLSMDTATHNANNLIISMKLKYNKTRQAAITRELTELSSSYKLTPFN
jgi:F-type H+-transporting ATPase subunit gamma